MEHGPRGTRDRVRGEERVEGRGAPVIPTLLLFLLVGVLVWASDEKNPPEPVIVENPTGEVLFADVVWKEPGGAVSGTFLQPVEAQGTLAYPVRPATVACVRVVRRGEVHGIWPVEPRSGERRVELDGGHGASGADSVRCPPEIVEHRVRPGLGRWLSPGEPDRIYRERIISRGLHRRGWQTQDRSRRSLGMRAGGDEPDGHPPSRRRSRGGDEPRCGTPAFEDSGPGAPSLCSGLPSSRSAASYPSASYPASSRSGLRR